MAEEEVSSTRCILNNSTNSHRSSISQPALSHRVSQSPLGAPQQPDSCRPNSNNSSNNRSNSNSGHFRRADVDAESLPHSRSVCVYVCAVDNTKWALFFHQLSSTMFDDYEASIRSSLESL